MTDDRLFQFIQKVQSDRPWGRVLDAGTGRHSLAWISSLSTTQWTAVTGEEDRSKRLEHEFRSRMRSNDRVVFGNWLDPAFLHNDVYDVVIADYLLGALDGFAPYFQDRLFPRLRSHVRTRIYVIGLQPYELFPDSNGGRIVREIARLRDACILLAGDRCYREYPLDWSIRHLEGAGFTVEEVQRFPIRYGDTFVREQLDVCERKLPRIADAALVSGLGERIDNVRRRALDLCRLEGGIRFGEDYVIAARPTS